MFAEKHYPEELLPEELDAYLARGWYRMGQSIFTTHFLCFGEQFYSAIWVRLNLANFTFSKSLRKLLRKNNSLFRTEFNRSRITPEKEELYQLYKESFPGILAPTLRESLLDGEDSNVFDTYEVNVYEGDKLIGVSFFDVGKDSAASIMGIYDPDYQSYSIGLYTLIAEIAFCLRNNFSYFYPGYVVPGYPRFDYKLRIGKVDYLNLATNEWQAFDSLQSNGIPIEKIDQKLLDLKNALQRQGIPCKKLYYPLFEANLFAFWQTDYFDFPLFLLCNPDPKEKMSSYFIIVYDMRDGAYHLLECSPLEDLMFYVNESYTNMFDRQRFFLELIVIKERLLRTTSHEHLQVVLMSLILSKRLK